MKSLNYCKHCGVRLAYHSEFESGVCDHCIETDQRQRIAELEAENQRLRALMLSVAVAIESTSHPHMDQAKRLRVSALLAPGKDEQ